MSEFLFKIDDFKKFNQFDACLNSVKINTLSKSYSNRWFIENLIKTDAWFNSNRIDYWSKLHPKSMNCWTPLFALTMCRIFIENTWFVEITQNFDSSFKFDSNKWFLEIPLKIDPLKNLLESIICWNITQNWYFCINYTLTNDLLKNHSKSMILQNSLESMICQNSTWIDALSKLYSKSMTRRNSTLNRWFVESSLKLDNLSKLIFLIFFLSQYDDLSKFRLKSNRLRSVHPIFGCCIDCMHFIISLA